MTTQPAAFTPPQLDRAAEKLHRFAEVVGSGFLMRMGVSSAALSHDLITSAARLVELSPSIPSRERVGNLLLKISFLLSFPVLKLFDVLDGPIGSAFSSAYGPTIAAALASGFEQCSREVFARLGNPTIPSLILAILKTTGSSSNRSLRVGVVKEARD